VARKKAVGGAKKALQDGQFRVYWHHSCGRSSVVERNVANVDVVSSSLIARFAEKRLFACEKGLLSAETGDSDAAGNN
jgi:hypothetical protein